MKKILLLFLIFGGTAYGQSWSPTNSPTSLNIKSCWFVSQDTGWVITSDSIFKTTNGGISWISQSYPPDPPQDIRFFNSIHFINSSVGIIGCGNYLYTGNDPSLVSNFLWTNDGGNNWIYKDLGTFNDYILDARLSSPTTAYGIGQYGEVTRTIDGGTSWINLYYTSQYSGNKLFPISEDTVYFAGVANLTNKAAFGEIISNSWTGSIVLPGPASSYFLSIYFFNHLEGWLCGSSGNLYKTTDGGVSWASQSSGVTGNINDIVFTDEYNGWFITNAGQIYHSSNSGTSWALEYSVSSFLNDICFSNNIGYAVGNGGIVLKYSSGMGIAGGGKSSIVKIFPNPSNDKLFMQLDNFFSRSTTFTIYNALGETVMNQKVSDKDASIDISALDIGIYFICFDNGAETTMQKIIKSDHE